MRLEAPAEPITLRVQALPKGIAHVGHQVVTVIGGDGEVTGRRLEYFANFVEALARIAALVQARGVNYQ